MEEIQPGDFLYALHSPDYNGPSHLIMHMEPSPTSRFRYQKTIASQDVLELLWDRHLKDSVAEVHHLYSALKGSSVTTNAAGGIIELRMHWLLRQGCFFVLFSFGHNRTTQKFDAYGNYTSKEEESLECPGLFGIFKGDWLDEGVQPQVDRYYRLKVSSLLTINSLLLIHPRIEPLPTLFMFRFTGEEECDVKDADLEKIERLKDALRT